MSSLDRGNRLVASALGLALAAGGAYGLGRSFGLVGRASDPVLGATLRRAVVENPGPVGGVATFVALLVAWAGWRWLRAQVRPAPSLGEVHVTEGDGGRTLLEARAVAEAVTRDLVAQPGVASGRVRVIGSPKAPGVDLHAELDDDVDLDEVRRAVDEVVVARLRSALERPDLPASVRYRLGETLDRSVR